MSLIMKIRRTQLPVMVNNDLFKNTYTLARKPGRLFGYDSSKTFSGRGQTKNWIVSALGDIKSSWTDIEHCDLCPKLNK